MLPKQRKKIKKIAKGLAKASKMHGQQSKVLKKIIKKKKKNG
jgi:uncharacterized protein (UPF0335 family)|tara:strand:- start:30 stop:155 length:126 start_codon:yes stop_codon:yes gene_type:complete